MIKLNLDLRLVAGSGKQGVENLPGASVEVLRVKISKGV